LPEQAGGAVEAQERVLNYRQRQVRNRDVTVDVNQQPQDRARAVPDCEASAWRPPDLYVRRRHVDADSRQGHRRRERQRYRAQHKAARLRHRGLEDCRSVSVRSLHLVTPLALPRRRSAPRPFNTAPARPSSSPASTTSIQLLSVGIGRSGCSPQSELTTSVTPGWMVPLLVSVPE